MNPGTLRNLEREWRGGIASHRNIANLSPVIRLQTRSRQRIRNRAALVRILALSIVAASAVLTAVLISIGGAP